MPVPLRPPHEQVVVLAARNEEALAQVAQEIRSAGGRAVHVAADVGREEDVARIAATAVAEFGRFDTWANVAGVSIFGHMDRVSTEDMRRMFDTTYWGVVHGSRAAIEHYRGRTAPGGAIVNVGSMFGDRATPLQSTCASAEFAVHGLTEAMRVELAAEGLPISVTLLHPGRIDTPYNEHAQSYTDRQPAHRGMIYAPEAVAEAILHAAEHPVRDLYIGGQVKAAVVATRLAPRLVDRVMRRYMHTSQLADRPSRRTGDSALHQPGYGLHERGTHQGRLYRSRSYYLKLEEHPRAVTTAVVGAGAALAGLRPARRLLRAAGR
ncbi:SDR family oxidoreductase [Quadrisphaera sp. DSM 44207]|uniref:SDR family oxidoreductase n=1 Tax=Quadrisphaera sp. DSM 44207 TaxID=1881057 RepID=UPI000892397A|nr:SDR family oxidoreductase [Quadrisphaera sp. DSM 44207]SDQ05936.1 Short-chain dehydrogenase [Quadrisphaera sp. DSM 44207]